MPRRLEAPQSESTHSSAPRHPPKPKQPEAELPPVIIQDEEKTARAKSRKVAGGLVAAQKKEAQEAEQKRRELGAAIHEGAEPAAEKTRKAAVLTNVLEKFGKEIVEKKDIEQTKTVLGQEKAARLWDEVMPMLWTRDETVGSSADIEAQRRAASQATEYVIRIGEIYGKHAGEGADEKIREDVKKLNAAFAGSGLLESYDPLVGAGMSRPTALRSLAQERVSSWGPIGTRAGFAQGKIEGMRLEPQRRKKYETLVATHVPEEKKELLETSEARGTLEQRERLLKLNEELHADIAELMKNKRTPEIQKQIDRKNGLISETETKLKELAQTTGDVQSSSEKKPSITERVKGFFRDLFGSATERIEEKRSPIQLAPRERIELPKDLPKTVPNAAEVFDLILSRTDNTDSSEKFVLEADKYLRAAKGGIESFMKPFENLVRDLDVENEPVVEEILEQAKTALARKKSEAEEKRAISEAHRRSRERAPTTASAAEILSRKRSSKPPMDKAA